MTDGSAQCGWGCGGPDAPHEMVYVYRSNGGGSWGVTTNSHWRGRNGWVGTTGKSYAYYNNDFAKALAYAERRVAAINSGDRVAVLALSHYARRFAEGNG